MPEGYVPLRKTEHHAVLAQSLSNNGDVTTQRSPAQNNTSSATARVASQLSDTYYVDNFNYLIKFVTRHYQHLLTADELKFCHTYDSLSNTAQQTYVRLASRSTDLLRTAKLHYPEIENISDGINELNSIGFVSKEVEFSSEECASLFTRAELKSVLGLSSSQFDPACINPDAFTTPDLFGDSPLTRLLANDSIIAVHHKELIVAFRLLFFGNLHQDFSSFVLRDLGLRQYENYKIDSDTVLFQEREQLAAHLHYYQCAELFDSACEQGIDGLQELHTLLPQPLQYDKTLDRRLDTFKNRIARQLERLEALDIAAQIYSQTTRPPARERLARIQAKSGNTDSALTLCKAIQALPLDTDELDFANTFGARLAKKAQQCFTSPARHAPPESTLQLHAGNLSVEFSVALHYAKTGKCYYLENSLLNGIFGLAFWDIIFAPVSGVFFHPFQHQPTDFYESEFTISREQMIRQRLQQIDNGQLQQIVNSHHYQKKGIRNPLVNWQWLKPHTLSLALKRIPKQDWQAIFKLMLSDIRNYRSGQPDLIYFPDDGGYELIEVKAPGDRLQKNQLRWMHFFNEQRMSHSVVHVEWIE